MLPNLVNNSIEVLSLPDSPEDYFSLLASFELPPLEYACALTAISCRCEPNPFGGSPFDASEVFDEDQQIEIAQSQQAQARRLIGPYRPDPKQAIILLQIYVRKTNLGEQWGIPERHTASLIIRRDEFEALTKEVGNGLLGVTRKHSQGYGNVVVPHEFLPRASQEGNLDDAPLEFQIGIETGTTIMEMEFMDDLNGEFSVELDDDDDDEDEDDEGPNVLNTIVMPSQAGDNIMSGRRASRELFEQTRTYRVVRWNEWKHASTLVSDPAHISSWITVSAGQRFIGLSDEGNVIIQDFQPRVNKEAWDLGLSKVLDGEAKYDSRPNDTPEYDKIYWEEGEFVTKTSKEEVKMLSKIFKDEDGFLKGIKYQQYISKEKVDYSGIMMDEGRIIGLYVSVILP